MPRDEQRDHRTEKVKRAERLSKGVYGEVGTPVIGPEPVAVDPPSYFASSRTYRSIRSSRDCGWPPTFSTPCFYTGVESPPMNPRDPITNFDPRLVPWLGTRDHIPPLRRSLAAAAGQDVEVVDFSRRQPAFVWSSYVANATLGLVPLPVRLKIREWLSTSDFDRADTSVEAGNNVRWLIIRMIDEFRIGKRLPWSRDEHQRWWDPDLQRPFMRHMAAFEQRFLDADEQGRDRMVRDFEWRF